MTHTTVIRPNSRPILNMLILWTISLCVLPSSVSALTKFDLYPYGEQHGDSVLSFQDESTSPEISLALAVTYFGVKHKTIYVNQNGLVSFGSEIPYFSNQEIRSFKYSLIAPFYADVDTYNKDDASVGNGAVYYRQEFHDQGLLMSASKLIRKKFSDAPDFTARSLFIVTWDNVGYYLSNADKRNTFQLVIISDDEFSYSAFLYADIQWIVSQGGKARTPDAPAQAGFVSDDGRFQTLPVSGTEDMAQITQFTNVETPGLFLFRVSGDNPTDPRLLDENFLDEDEDDYEDDDYDANDDYDTNEIGDIPDPPPPPPRGEQSTQATTVVYSRPSEEEEIVNKTEDYIYHYDDYKEPECPMNPYGDLCPSDCVPTTDEMDCPICVCGDLPASPAQESGSCNDPFKYYECGTTCPLGCDNLANQPETCTPECVYGCFCIEGYIFQDSRNWRDSPCVPLTSCPSQPAQPEPQVQAVQPPLVPVAPPLTRNSEDEGRGRTCASISREGPVCSTDGMCRDYPGGYCCECGPGFYGNGKECLNISAPQRINGKFSGTINGRPLEETDVHTYVILEDGRSYTALSQMSDELGPSMLLLNSIGGVMGWLFAKVDHPNAYNGFTLTGGILNRTVTVHIADTHTLTIQQEFSGKDIFHSFKAKFYVTGSLPRIPLDAQVTYSDYEEEYRRVSPGVVKSYSSPVVRAGNQEFRLTVDQTIKYTECSFREFTMPQVMRVRVERSYVVYEQQEKIVRFASMNTVSPSEAGENDPCREGAHTCNGEQQICVPDGRTFRCLCMDGYEMKNTNELGNTGTCVDLNECTRGISTCDQNADCLNTEGSFVCRCRAGFRGTGQRCIREENQSCGGRVCHANAVCLSSPRGGVECTCAPGYYGNGVDCRPDQQPQTTPAPTGPEGIPCSAHSDCNQRTGMCKWNIPRNRYECACRDGYVGDGTTCNSATEQTCDIARNCDQHADCILEGQAYICRCRAGYSGDGKTCTESAGPGGIDCTVVNNCHESAQCVQDWNTRRHVCQCNEGFSGDGYTCISTGPAENRCATASECHQDAHCILLEDNKTLGCVCLPGHRGDGKTFCDPSDECAVGEANSVCSADADCMYLEVRRAYVCQCKRGFEGDGRQCTPSQVPPGCDSQPNLCHPNAQCQVNYQSRQYECQCNTGFVGDGYTNCQPQAQGCDILQNCHTSADCILDNGNMRYFCKCRYGYEGDGYSCRPKVSCLDRPELCHEFAVCAPDNMGYNCRCQRGYHGDGQTCSPDSELRGRALVYGQGMSVVVRGLGPNEPGKQLVVIPWQTVVGVAFDCKDERIYWTDVSRHHIRSAKVDGTEIVVVANESLVSSPEGIAIDFASRNLYYADSDKDIIGVTSLDGQYHKTLLDGLVNPRALAIDITGRKLYYSDWNRDRPLIGRMALNGEEHEDFVTDQIVLPNSMVILSRRRELCWVDAGRNTLECIGLDGRSRRVVFPGLPYPFGLAVYEEETFFTTDWEDKNLHSISVLGGGHQVFNASLAGSGKLYGMVALEEQCPSGATECGEGNGGCQFLCLPSPRTGSKCYCPDNIDSEKCNSVD